MNERRVEDLAVGNKLSRRSLVARATFFGATMAAIGDVAKAQDAGSGNRESVTLYEIPKFPAAYRRSYPSRSPNVDYRLYLGG